MNLYSKKIVKIFFGLIIVSQLFLNFSLKIQAVDNNKVLGSNLEDDAILDTTKKFPNYSSSQGSENNTLLIIVGITGGIIFFAGTIYILYKNLIKNGQETLLFRDQVRKHDIERIRYSLSAFYKSYNYYPNSKKGEFQDLISRMDPIPRDPSEGKDVTAGRKFGYYYDNQSLEATEKGRENDNHYRIWAYVENSNDPDMNPAYSKPNKNVYLRTSRDPLNPALLEEPVQKKVKKITDKPKIMNAEEIEEQRKESTFKFMLILTSLGLAISAILNGILYSIIQGK